MPTDPTTVSAFATILQAGVVGAFLLLLTFGVYRHRREVEREQLAVAKSEKREEEANSRNEKIIATLERVSESLDRLIAAVDKLVTR